MSALPPKADIFSALAHVFFGPKADSDVIALLDRAKKRPPSKGRLKGDQIGVTAPYRFSL